MSERSAGRFAGVPGTKASGATYTPREIADYLAEQIAESARIRGRDVSILDPAAGDGALSLAMLRAVYKRKPRSVRLVGHETDARAAGDARLAIRAAFPEVEMDLRETDFLAREAPATEARPTGAPTGTPESLLGGHDSASREELFDLAIANPPYVRTQILGAAGAGLLAKRYGLAGRLDLYQAFVLEAIARLRDGGALGALLSNRFLSTKGGGPFREAMRARLDLRRVWDLGDTRVFDASVLPAMVLGKKASAAESARFTAIYRARGDAGSEVESLAEALEREGHVRLGGRVFAVSQGALHGGPGEVWRVSSAGVDDWLRSVREHTWRTLGDVARIRVGIKTTADPVFIRDDWGSMGDRAPELLRPIITHHAAGRYRGSAPDRQVLYPHLAEGGKRAVADLSLHPRSEAYLSRHRSSLEARRYVLAAGKRWYEIWVPQDPRRWGRPKIVFRDISERPTFWIDESGSVVNGDCYWLALRDRAADDVLWLCLAVANSRFIEAFYDRCFHNKLYSRRRRFMRQYVEKFPLPSPASPAARRLVALAKRRYASEDPAEQRALERSMDALVYRAFGLAGDPASPE